MRDYKTGAYHIVRRGLVRTAAWRAQKPEERERRKIMAIVLSGNEAQKIRRNLQRELPQDSPYFYEVVLKEGNFPSDCKEGDDC